MWGELGPGEGSARLGVLCSLHPRVSFVTLPSSIQSVAHRVELAQGARGDQSRRGWDCVEKGQYLG